MHRERKNGVQVCMLHQPGRADQLGGSAPQRCIVAKCPGLAGTVPEFGPMSRLCPALPDFAALSRNPARLYKWRCGTSINSVYYRISVRISRCLVGVAAHDRPKVGVVDQKWAWSVNFRARFARVNTIFYFVPASLLIHLATMKVLSETPGVAELKSPKK